jgi:signal transduction histidine kinase
MGSPWTAGWVALGAASGLCVLALGYAGSAATTGDRPVAHLLELHQQWPVFLALDALPLLLGWVGWLVAQLRARDEALAKLISAMGPFSDGALARTLLDAVLIAEADGQIVAANLSARVLFGLDPVGESIHTLLLDLSRPDPPTTERRDRDGQLLGLQWHLVARGPDGRFVPVRVTCGPAAGHRVVYILTPDESMGDAPQAQAVLMRERERVRSTLQAQHGLLSALARSLSAELARLAPLGADPEILGRMEDMLDWGQLESGRLSIQLEPCTLAPLFEEVRARTAERGLVLLFRGAPLVLRGDGPRLVRILTMLVRYVAGPGPAAVRLVARLDPEDPRMVHLEISTPNRQLPELSLEEPLYDAEGHLSSDRLGLRLAKRLVAAMGGSLTLPSPGISSAFHLRLPAAVDPRTLVPSETYPPSLVPSHPPGP